MLATAATTTTTAATSSSTTRGEVETRGVKRFKVPTKKSFLLLLPFRDEQQPQDVRHHVPHAQEVRRPPPEGSPRTSF